MKKNEFFLYLSQKTGSEAAKEVSLKVKSNFRQNFHFAFILFTPQYKPELLLKTFNLTLDIPLFGLQAPFLIYGKKIISRGVLACCIGKKDAAFDIFFIGHNEPEKIKTNLKNDFKKFKKDQINFISFLSPRINPLTFLESLRFSLGRLNNFFGAGNSNSSYSDDCFIFNAGTGSGLVNLNLRGINHRAFAIHNFIPIGKPFNITGFNFEKQLIHEINGRPAAEIYSQYAQEKYKLFIENKLFRYYPLGIPNEDYFRLLEISDVLEDGSLVYKGNLRYNATANIMLLRQAHALEQIKKQLQQKNREEGLVFLISSLSRKKILGNKSEREIEEIEKIYWPNKQVFGFFSDYYFFSNYKNQDINMESGGLLINVWE